MNRLMIVCLLLVTLLISIADTPPATAGEDRDKGEIRLGVLDRGAGSTLVRRWSPTVRYLEGELPGLRITLIPLRQEEIRRGGFHRYLDLLIIDPAGYVLTAGEHALRPLATLTQIRMGMGLGESGGVIFTRNDPSAPSSVADLTGRSLLTTYDDDFFAWQTACREMRNRGIDPDDDLGSVRFIYNEELVILGVLGGEAEVGTVSLGLLEEMALLGKIGLDSYRVLNPRRIDIPFQSTTTTYPGWICAALPHLESRISDQLAQTLMKMPPGHQAASAVRSAGWTTPGDYLKVQECLLALGGDTLSGDTSGEWLEAATILLLPILSVLGIMGIYLFYSVKVRKLQWELAQIKDPPPPSQAGIAARETAELAGEILGVSSDGEQQEDEQSPPPPTETAANLEPAREATNPALPVDDAVAPPEESPEVEAAPEAMIPPAEAVAPDPSFEDLSDLVAE